ncbi:MAG: hypothetical protein M1836_006421 [Candelina mexicana]|nr:MAG: hypothetical protein M1836_006421 [Candelina mexicana]
MAILNGVEVHIRSEHKNLDEYDDPEGSQQADPRVVTKYIEAVTNAKFTIAARLRPSFSFGASDGVRIEFRFDGVGSWWGCFIAKKGYVYKRSGHDYKCSFLPRFCTVTKQYRKSGFTFGAIKLSNEAPPFVTTSPTNVGMSLDEESSPSSKPPESLSSLGTIEVRVRRAHIKKRLTPTSVSISERDDEGVSEVPEKLLKGRAISNTVKLVLGAPVAPSKPTGNQYEPISGSMGLPITFKFLYRSRNALQITGILPRSPSPEAAPIPRQLGQPSLENTLVDLDDRGTDLEDKIASLQAQLALLKEKEKRKNTGIKSEGAANPTSQQSSSSTSSQGSRIKRERAESEHDVKISQATARTKRIRKSNEIESVDLTGDVPVVKQEYRSPNGGIVRVVDLSEE